MLVNKGRYFAHDLCKEKNGAERDRNGREVIFVNALGKAPVANYPPPLEEGVCIGEERMYTVDTEVDLNDGTISYWSHGGRPWDQSSEERFQRRQKTIKSDRSVCIPLEFEQEHKGSLGFIILDHRKRINYKKDHLTQWKREHNFDL